MQNPRFELDPEVNALYVRLRDGEVAQTREIEALIVADYDAAGEPLGVEFVDAVDFVPFLRRSGGGVDLPESLREVFAPPPVRQATSLARPGSKPDGH